MRIFLFTLLTFNLVACDGIDLDADNSLNSDSEDRIFTRPELAFSVLYSSIVLNNSGLSGNRDGFVVLFTNTSELSQIELRSDDSDDAIVGNYTWTIANDDLQVTYANGAVCTSSKTSETGSQITATSTCSNGEPNNDRIRNTLNSPLSFDTNDLEERRITIENDDQDQQIEFFSNGTYQVTDLDSDGDEISGTVETGNYIDNSDLNTELNNVVRLNNSVSNKSTLFILLEGSLTDGTLLSLQYSTEIDGVLEDIRIYDIDENNRWETDSQYDSITVDE